MNYEILLYYKFVTIYNPLKVIEQHRTLCDKLKLKGRIFIGQEGINGTVSGRKSDTQAYQKTMSQDPLFRGIKFKVDVASEHAFQKMHIRLKDEIVRLELPQAPNPQIKTAPALSPVTFKAMMKQDDVVLLDTRNHYEYALGHFKGAINPEIHNFRELPQWLKKNQDNLKGKTILTYCTGGIRCEKITGWMLENAFTSVYQLDGGILTYGQDDTTLGSDWEGQCYVFDERVGVPINRLNPSIVGRDYFDGTPCERYINCANPECNKKILCSLENERIHQGSCSDSCREHPQNRYTT